MHTLRILAAALLVSTLGAAFSGSALAGYPPYLILQTPPSGPRQVPQGSNPGIAHGVSTPAYSYGYFGVQPRKHVSRHYGYYRNYTEWSCK
jgi:hypothetical protein